MNHFKRSLPRILVGTVALLLLVGVACAGGSSETVAPAPAPDTPAAPAPAAPEPAAEPVALPKLSGKDCRLGAPVAQCGEPKFGGILRLAHRKDPRAGWDHMQTATYDNTHVTNSVTGSGNLVRSCRDNVYAVCPGLAESWESNADFTQWTFKIREGVLWHDGEPFTPEDVKFWIDINFKSTTVGATTRPGSYFRGNFKDIEQVDVLDGNRVRITLGSPAPQYILGIGIPRMTIFHPKHLMQPFFDRGEVNVRPNEVGYVGTGPYVFQKFVKGSNVEVRRFDKYWEKDGEGNLLPYLDGIDWFILGSPSNMDAAFRTNRIDGGARGSPYYPDPERRGKYTQDMGDDVWFASYGAQTGGWSFNTIKSGPLQDIRVRKALALWVDKQAALAGLGGGDGVIGTILNPANPITSPDFMTWPGYNPDKTADRAEAKRLMAEAGYADGIKLDLMLPRRWVRQGEFQNADVAGLGVDLKINLLDEAAFTAARLGTEWDTEYNTTSGGPRFPEDAASWLNTFDNAPAARMKHQDPKVAELLSGMLTSVDQKLRTDLWRQLEHYMIVEKVYFVPTYSGVSFVPYRSYVKGIPPNKERVQEYLDFTTVWLDQ